MPGWAVLATSELLVPDAEVKQHACVKAWYCTAYQGMLLLLAIGN